MVIKKAGRGMSEKEFSTFMDGEDCPDCTHYEKQIKQLQAENAQLKKRVEELESQKCLKHCCERMTFAV